MKPSVPKGTRDYLPAEVYKREYIFNTIKKVFEEFSYVPIQTPTMEKLSTLTGKYGEEGDKLLFKILNNGDFLSKADQEALANKNSQKLVSSISKRGLRYDLTVPFARYVVQHQNDLYFPFKRYQIQPVWRADRPQRGRYNEFYQCDVDVVGSESLIYEAELVQIYDKVFSALGINVTIRVNNRKVLFGYAESLGLEDLFLDMTICLDKLDKIGEEKVVEEMVKKGIDQVKAEKIISYIKVSSLSDLESAFANSPTGLNGLEELGQFHSYLDLVECKNKVMFDPSLARGLNYYTGCIFEVEANDVKIGSIGGGGRYDDLTSVFGLKGVSGVGVSFGFARIYDVMNELELFPEALANTTKVLVVCMDNEYLTYGFTVGSKLRAAGIATDIYPEAKKLKKQLGYANSKEIPYAIIIGEEEINSDSVQLKDMKTGNQRLLSIEQVLKELI